MSIPKVSHLIPSILAVLLAAAAVPSEAHHSFAAEYDSAKPVTVTGVVTRIEWTNPHAYIYVDVTDKDGKVTSWGFEMGPPAQQIRRGWEPDSFKPGDKVTLDMHPLKDGSRGGQLVNAILPNGQKVGGAGAPPIR